MMLFKKIIWSVSTIEDIRFIQRFKNEFKGEIILIHTNLITYFYSKYNLKIRSYIPKFKGKYYSCQNIERSFNVLSGRLSLNEASKAYSATLDLLTELENNKEIDRSNLYLIPSGRHIHQWAIKDYAISIGARKLFINYANFPGYTIFDPSGTDRNSSIYGNSDILKKIKKECYSNEEVEEIFDRFIELKRKQLKIPQKSGGYLSKFFKVMLFSLDTLIQSITNIYSDRRVRINIKNTERKNKMEVDFTQLSTIDDFDNCIFFPLQVSTDQQVLINYRGGSIEAAIKEVIAYANMKNLKLVLKDHPGEHNIKNIRNLVESICRDSSVDYFWVNDRVPYILDKIHRVITINSTVGLEALINGNNVKFIGDSVYNGMSKQELAKYLNDYLVPVDYQTDTTICDDLVNKILLRA